MSKSTYPLKLPLSIKKAAQWLAKEDGVSLNQWIAAAVAEKVGVVETAAAFFKKRAGKATGRTHEVSAHRAQGRARCGARALRESVKINAQTELGRGTLRMSDDCDGPWPPADLLQRRRGCVGLIEVKPDPVRRLRRWWKHDLFLLPKSI
jgi:hypothetical protein